jgi:ferredoxin--NADP+ reductase
MSLLLTVTEVEHYTDSLFRIQTERPQTYRFNAGEFTMIGLPDSDVSRAYSFTSGPGDDYLEFYSIKVPNGPLTGRLQHVKPGDTLEVGDKPTGSLTLANLELGGNLWMFATGTGIAPFISLLRDMDTYSAFDHINLCWTVREIADLQSYNAFLEEMSEEMNLTYFPTVTRDLTFKNHGRIQKFIDLDWWFADTDPSKDKAMICGSIEFNNDIGGMLKANGWSEGTRKSAGTFVVERAFVG